MMVNFKVNIDKLYSMMDKCNICPKKCGVNRNRGQQGLCKTADKIFVASINVHTGEEPPISAKCGSGTIFFSNCTLNCVFCQNYPISQLGNGKEISLESLVDSILNLQKRGVHNINLEVDKNAIAKKGIIVRHLVLPGNVNNTKNVLKFIAKDLSTNTYVSLMSQYHTAL